MITNEDEILICEWRHWSYWLYWRKRRTFCVGI